MRGLESLAARIRELENTGGYAILDDGTKFRPGSSGICMMVSEIRLARDLGREPVLSDFPEDEQEQWRNYAKWSPDPSQHGAISVLISQMAKKLITASN